MDEMRLDKLKSSDDFARVGMDLRDAALNKGRVRREADRAKKKADRRLRKLQLREARRSRPPSFLSRVWRTILWLAVLAAIWITAMTYLIGSP